jgi:hypothetical protein
MRWTGAMTLCAALAALSGCRNCSRVEAELAAREKDVATLKEELSRTEFVAHGLMRELAARDGVPGPDGVVRPPTTPYPVRSIRLGRRTSQLPDGDGLEVQIEPIDTEGQAIKAPGLAQVEVQELTPEGLKKPLSYWDLSPDQLRRSWQSGLFSQGYILTFRWKAVPRTEKLRVIARFRMMDGRTFETDKDITLSVPPYRGKPPAEPELPMPLPEKPAEKAPEKMPPAEGPTLTSGAATILRPVPAKEE